VTRWLQIADRVERFVRDPGGSVTQALPEP
jgi:hypothetical protein